MVLAKHYYPPKLLPVTLPVPTGFSEVSFLVVQKELLHTWLSFSTDQAQTHSYASLRQGEGLLRLWGQGGRGRLKLQPKKTKIHSTTQEKSRKRAAPLPWRHASDYQNTALNLYNLLEI